MRRVKF